MKKLSLFLFVLFSSLAVYAQQLPPSNFYNNLGVYRSCAVYEDGQSVPFNGIDYFYIDFDSDGSIYTLWQMPDGVWESSPADYSSKGADYIKYESYNGNQEDIEFLLSPDNRNVLVAREGEPITVLYTLINGGNSYSTGSYTPSYEIGGYTPSNGGSSSGSSSTYSACRICGGSGTCTSCHGTGGEWRNTGYYTGSDSKSWIECPSCHGNKKCFNCHGTGRQ